MARKIHPLVVEETKGWLSAVDAFVCVDLTGIGATETNVLRKEIRAVGGSLRWLKNSAATKALEEIKKGNASSAVEGPTAAAWGEADTIVSVCRILDEWKGKTKKVSFRGAWLQGQVLSPEEVGRLALIPPREQLHAMVVGALAAPVSGLVSVLGNLIRGLTIVIKGISERSSEDG